MVTIHSWCYQESGVAAGDGDKEHYHHTDTSALTPITLRLQTHVRREN